MTLRILALLFLAVRFSATAGATGQGEAAEPEAATSALPVWETLVYEEKAFWATARSRLSLDHCPRTGDAWCLEASSSVANNRERITLSAHADGRLLERDRFSEGSNRRRKQWRFGLNQVTRERREQDRSGEWQITSRVEVDYPQGETPVTDAMLLLALIEVSEAAQTFVVNTDLNFYRITVTPAGEDLVEVAPGLGGIESRHRDADLLAITAELIQPAQDKPDFSLLGLSGELLIAFDRATGLPLQVRGRAPRLGYVALTPEIRGAAGPTPVTALRPNAPVGLVSNPASGHNRDQFARLRARIEASPSIHHIVTRGAEDIPAALSTLRDAGVEVLAINGGDGTNAALLGAMLEQQIFEQPPLVVLLPGGTANMNAGDVGMRGSLAKAVERFCDWCDGDRALKDAGQQRALLRVENAGRLHHGMFLGAGAVIQGTEYAHREIHSRGLRDDFSLALGTLRTVWGVVRGDAEFTGHQRIGLGMDGGQRQDHDTLILAISTLQRLAFGMRPFWGEGSGALRLTLMEQGCSRFAHTFASIARGRPGRNAVPAEGYFSHNADQVELFMEGKVNLDGEILPVDGELRITTTEPLTFIAP